MVKSNADAIIQIIKDAQDEYFQRTKIVPNTIKMASWQYAELIIGQVPMESAFAFDSMVITMFMHMRIHLDDRATKITCYYEEIKLQEIICKNCGAPSVYRICEYCQTRR